MIEFFDHVPNNGEIELTLLKGHLLIEKLLHKELIRTSRNPEVIEKMNISFSTMIGLVRSYSDLEKEWIWPALKMLNQARNQLAHSLSKKEIEEKVDGFVKFVLKHESKITEEVINERFTHFHWALYKLYISIAVHVHLDRNSIKIPTIFDNLKIRPNQSE